MSGEKAYSNAVSLPLPIRCFQIILFGWEHSEALFLPLAGVHTRGRHSVVPRAGAPPGGGGVWCCCGCVERGVHGR